MSIIIEIVNDIDDFDGCILEDNIFHGPTVTFLYKNNIKPCQLHTPQRLNGREAARGEQGKKGKRKRQMESGRRMQGGSEHAKCLRPGEL